VFVNNGINLLGVNIGNEIKNNVVIYIGAGGTGILVDIGQLNTLENNTVNGFSIATSTGISIGGENNLIVENEVINCETNITDIGDRKRWINNNVPPILFVYTRTVAHDINEHIVIDVPPTKASIIAIRADINDIETNEAPGFTLTTRLYEAIDGTNFRPIRDEIYEVGLTTTYPNAYIPCCPGHQIRLTFQTSAAVGVDRTIPILISYVE